MKELVLFLLSEKGPLSSGSRLEGFTSVFRAIILRMLEAACPEAAHLGERVQDCFAVQTQPFNYSKSLMSYPYQVSIFPVPVYRQDCNSARPRNCPALGRNPGALAAVYTMNPHTTQPSQVLCCKFFVFTVSTTGKFRERKHHFLSHLGPVNGSQRHQEASPMMSRR